MTEARRALKRPTTRWLWVVVMLLVVTVAALLGSTQAPVRTVTVASPVEYRDWPVYVPVTPQSCRDLITETERIYWSSIDLDEAGRKAADRLRTAKTVADVKAAKRANDEARRAAKILTESRRAYLDESKKCREAK